MPLTGKRLYGNLYFCSHSVYHLRHSDPNYSGKWKNDGWMDEIKASVR